MPVTFVVVDPSGEDARWAMTQYFEEIDERFEQGFDPGDALDSGAAAMREPEGVFVVAYEDGAPIACGGLQPLGDGIGELKRMWVADRVRGQGLGRRMLGELEAHAERLGLGTIRLDTNSQLPEAVALYRRSGYVEIERYNDNPYPDHFFEKSLQPAP